MKVEQCFFGVQKKINKIKKGDPIFIDTQKELNEIAKLN